jgi:LDH2 family malate/lactate/ureidoglycolate dehydrogenase
MNPRYLAADLVQFGSNLLQAKGLASDRADIVSEVLVEGDLFGHSTHGLQMLSPYLKSIESGDLNLTGEPEVISDRKSAITWNGNNLPGPWLTMKAIDLAESRIAEFGVVTVNILKSHHLACLQSYLKRVTDKNRVILLLSSDPSVSTVAPHGGLKPLYTPNPLAMGIPTTGNPILIDISMSITTNGRCMRTNKSGEKLPGQWLKNAEGQATDDPSVLFNNPPGSILPLGGLDYGHKGFALGLMIEALTSALGGSGRADEPSQWGASVFLQIIDPEFFGGADKFAREMGFIANACHTTPVNEGSPPVRLPGEAGLKKREAQLKDGVELYPGIMDGLKKWAAGLGGAIPAPIN